ncbi:MAG: beta-propeller fold lactonase family protein [Deltaproteobacteria bacterium]|nr:beta-propeller fold lactonase family protein [Deltaproteobacteria bacterium]
MTRTCIALLLAFAACAGSPRGLPPDRGELQWPISVAVDPAGDVVYVVSSNFDAAFNGGSIIPVSVSAVAGKAAPTEPPRVLSLDDPVLGTGGAAVVGSFAGEMAFVKTGDTTAGYVAVRDGDRLQWFTVGRGSGGAATISCVTAPEGGSRCDDDHTLDLGWEDPTERYGTLEAADPYALAVGAGVDPDAPLLYVGSIRGGDLYVLSIGAGGRPALVTAVPLSSGVHSITEGPLVGGRRIVYVTTRFSNTIHVVEVARAADGTLRAEAVEPVVIPQISSTGDYWRGIATSPDGRRLYAALRSPNSLAVFDIAPEDGRPSLRGLIALYGGPAGVAVVPGAVPGQDTVYVTDFARDGLYAVDTLSMSVTDRIPIGDGPYGIAITSAAGGTGRRAWIALFEEAALSVVDLEPGSPTFHTEIARVR